MKITKIFGEETDIVNYLGVPLFIPHGFNYLFIDDDGKVWASVEKPTRNYREGCWHLEGESIYVATVQVEDGYWYNSVRAI